MKAVGWIVLVVSPVVAMNVTGARQTKEGLPTRRAAAQSTKPNLPSVPLIVARTPSTNPVVGYQKSLTLSVEVSAAGQSSRYPLRYQWRINATNIAGAIASSYTLTGDTDAVGTYSVVVTNIAGSTNVSWEVTVTYAGSYVDAGTFAHHLSTNVVGRKKGFSGSHQDMLEIRAPASTNLDRITKAVWSTNFWLHGVRGLSATPIGFRDLLGGQGLPTMVSPRHYLCASHMHPEGQTLAFLDINNVIHWRKTLERVDIPSSYTAGVGNDTTVGILNADLPSSAGFLPIVPRDFRAYVPTNGTQFFQGIGMNQDLKLFSQPMWAGPLFGIYWRSQWAAPLGLPADWGITLRGGDSSAPGMILVGNQLVLISHNRAVGGGPDYSLTIGAINHYMHYLSTNNAAGTDYQLTEFSLTNWPTVNQ